LTLDLTDVLTPPAYGRRLILHVQIFRSSIDDQFAQLKLHFGSTDRKGKILRWKIIWIGILWSLGAHAMAAEAVLRMCYDPYPPYTVGEVGGTATRGIQLVFMPGFCI
jgi:hypothetical protein